MNTEEIEADDHANTFIVEHIVIRDRATGEVLLNRRVSANSDCKISKEELDADQSKTDG